MSAKKSAKSNAAPKRKVPAKRSAVPAHDAASESLSGRFWTQLIPQNGVAFLAQNMMPVHFVLKNLGTETVMLIAEHGVRMDVPAGTVQATYAAGHITVENRSDKPVLILFEFLPICRK